ncbi:hypothetical protein BHU48_11410 [Corynebacterium diphtheriae]|nr:hypothetical protein BHU48_11410 [Corynebacterium diphtheriae]
MAQHFAVKPGKTTVRRVVTLSVGLLAILSVLAFVFSGIAFEDEPLHDLTEDVQTSINDEQRSEDTQSDNDITVPSVTEFPTQVEEETTLPSFPEPDMVAPPDDETGTQADSG